MRSDEYQEQKLELEDCLPVLEHRVLVDHGLCLISLGIIRTIEGILLFWCDGGAQKGVDRS